MKAEKRSKDGRGCRVAAWLAAGALVVGTPISLRAINYAAPGADTVKQGASAAEFSAGVADIVKMVDAKVDPGVIETYIKQSPTAYNPDATEIIALKDRGVGPELLTAMLQRGAELRAQAARAAQAVSNPPPAPAAATAYVPNYDYRVQPLYSGYTYPANSYVYPSYSYAYPASYNGGYNYGIGWPWYWPSYSFGCYPYRGYGGYSYCSSGYRYPYGCGGYGNGRYYAGHGYRGGGAYYGGRGYYGVGGYSGGRSYYGSGTQPVPYAGLGGGFHSAGPSGRTAAFSTSGAGFRAGGGFSGRAVSFSGHGGGAGGRSMGRSR